MGKIEVWEQRDGAQSEISSEDELEAKRIPLFDRLLPKAAVDIQPKQESHTDTQSGSVSQSETSEDPDYFQSDSSPVSAEAQSEDADYDADWRKLQAVRANNRLSPATYADWRAFPRAWDSVFYISSIHNLENAEQRFFYCIRVKHVNERISRASGLGNITMYTPHFTLKPGEDKKLQNPMFIWHKRRLTLPYGQLQHYVVEIELWKTHRLRINSLYAKHHMNFQEIIDRNANFSVTLNLHVPAQNAAAEAGSGGRPGREQDASAITEASERRFPVQKVTLFLLLEEVFDFFFIFENWWFTMAPELPPPLRELPKTMKVSVPTGVGKSWRSSRTNASEQAYWSSPGTFRFQGTLRQLRYASFTAKVFCVGRGRLLSKPPVLLGTCVMSLKSVQELPLVRGVLKKLTLGTRNMFSGTVQGNIRCCMKSCTVNFFEDLKARPAQPISGSALITQLDHRCQYLVVRVVSCASLPASNTDSNTSDPMVKVKWDGIVNCTGVLESTVSPVYNQNMYFPIHLVDQRELTDPALIRHSLPVDLSSKGPVVVEVWDHCDAASELLGSVEIPLSRIYTHGVLQRRSLVDGIFTSGTHEPAEEAAEEPAEELESEEAVSFTGDSASRAPYRQHVTRLYEDTLALTGATVPHRGRKPTVSLQMYILPPMPNDLYIPEDQTKRLRTDIYRDLGRRWTRDFETWQLTYSDRFPGAVARRRFTCVTTGALVAGHGQQSDVVPLCCFVKPIQMYIQLSAPGELMHWISNFTCKEDGTTAVGGNVLIETWQMPSRFVLTRKGGLHDRALLLCSCLLGLGYDAYVCKGTLDGGRREHCWVMTRHSDGTVTFWETANKRMWHLPMRWKTRYDPPEAKPVSAVEESGNYAPLPQAQPAPTAPQGHALPQVPRPGRRLMNYELYGNDYMADVKVDMARVLGGNDVVADGSASMPAQTTFLADTRASERAARGCSAIDPKVRLLVPGQTLVCLPYSSVETVFNDRQLWGNLQNHHPSCITYDLDVADEWRPFLKAPLTDAVMPDVQITAPLPQATCFSTAKEIRNDVVEMIELMYARRGRVANIACDQQMDERLESLIDILEFRQRLDMQFDPGMPPHLLGWSTKRKGKQRSAAKAGGATQADANTADEVAASHAADARALPTTLSGVAAAVDGGAVQPERSVIEVAHQLAKGAKDKEAVGRETESDETAASTDDSIVFDPAVVPGRHTLDNAINPVEPARQPKPPPRRKPGLLSRMRAVILPEPRHRAMALWDYGVSAEAATARRRFTAKVGLGGFRLRKSAKLNAPKIDILRVLSQASEVVVSSNVEKLSDYRTEVDASEALLCPVEDALSEVSTPTSVPGLTASLPWNHPLSDFKQCIESAVHLRAPVLGAAAQEPQANPVGAPDPQPRPGAIRRATSRPGFFRSLWNRFRAHNVPDAHALPEFMVDMEAVFGGRRLTPQDLEHKYPIPQEFRIHEGKQVSKWNWYYNMEARQYAWRRHLPIPPNHTFVGTPIHFCTSDLNEVRHLLTCSSRFKRMLVPDVDRCINVVYVKVFPLLGGLDVEGGREPVERPLVDLVDECVREVLAHRSVHDAVASARAPGFRVHVLRQLRDVFDVVSAQLLDDAPELQLVEDLFARYCAIHVEGDVPGDGRVAAVRFEHRQRATPDGVSVLPQEPLIRFPELANVADAAQRHYQPLQSYSESPTAYYFGVALAGAGCGVRSSGGTAAVPSQDVGDDNVLQLTAPQYFDPVFPAFHVKL
ncbi:C2 domain-containing protein, putative [Babesia caballi]|uniref:C2 domain-containing protein, putative n=1 Tax=Babesia caballi TaxID=5871 RepID=A0AAV4LU19_BABCB|nr:C2 domain-containing protein, putative [Babesia caballi]